MHITTSAYAAALYGGLLGAFLEASRDTISQGHDQNHLQQCCEWLLMHNPLICQFDWHLHAPTSPFPTIHISDSILETNPPMRPEVIMDPVTFQSEVNQEDYRHFRLPVTYIQDQS